MIRSSKLSLISTAVALALIATTATAGGPPPSSSSPDADAIAAALAAAGAQAGAGALSGSSSGAYQGQSLDSDNDNRSSSHSSSGGGRALSGSSSQSGDATVTVEGDSEHNTYRSTSRALALTLPGLVAAPAVPGECRVHKAGWGFFSAGKTGATELQELCMDRQHCLTMADRFAAWGLIDVAARQLTQCGAVQADVSMRDRTNKQPTAAPVDTSQFVTREELIERDQRMIEKLASK